MISKFKKNGNTEIFGFECLIKPLICELKLTIFSPSFFSSLSIWRRGSFMFSNPTSTRCTGRGNSVACSSISLQNLSISCWCAVTRAACSATSLSSGATTWTRRNYGLRVSPDKKLNSTIFIQVWRSDIYIYEFRLSAVFLKIYTFAPTLNEAIWSMKV